MIKIIALLFNMVRIWYKLKPTKPNHTKPNSSKSFKRFEMSKSAAQLLYGPVLVLKSLCRAMKLEKRPVTDEELHDVIRMLNALWNYETDADKAGYGVAGAGLIVVTFAVNDKTHYMLLIN